LVGLRGRLIGMLSGLLEPPEPEAASGGFIIGALLSCGTGFAVCANAAAPLAAATASAMRAVSVVHLRRFIWSSFVVLAAGFAVGTLVVIDPNGKRKFACVAYRSASLRCDECRRCAGS
jgi:uncharacterized membrane protein (DUF4010 family)